jgi:hypothetical protein
MDNPQPRGLAAWRHRNRFRIQSVALVFVVAGSLALYWALEAGRGGLAAAAFGAVALAMFGTLLVS